MASSHFAVDQAIAANLSRAEFESQALGKAVIDSCFSTSIRRLTDAGESHIHGEKCRLAMVFGLLSIDLKWLCSG
jgi:hypothetical protein